MIFRHATQTLLVLCGLALGSIGSARAGDFVISPLRVTLSREVKSTQIEIRNDDTRPLRVQMQAMAWSQDDGGKDQYAESDGLLFFPKSMEIPPGQSHIVRLGPKALPASVEDAYRLFIAELPGPEDAAATGSASVRILLRVGVAVFVAPLEPRAAAEFRSLALHHGAAELTVSNTGNVHIAADRLAIVGLDRDGKPLFETPLQDRYFLAGTTKQLHAQIPRDQCAQLAGLQAVLVGSGVDLKRRLDVSSADCK
jgi:fimbrial chaperone protein